MARKNQEIDEVDTPVSIEIAQFVMPKESLNAKKSSIVVAIPLGTGSGEIVPDPIPGEHVLEPAGKARNRNPESCTGWANGQRDP
jgi:hypothetical protein